MGEIIKPDLILNMKRKWFAKIWNGEKDVEYREVKPYWQKRIGEWVGKRGKFVCVVLGYRRETAMMLLQVDKVDVGDCPHEGFDGVYFRLHFQVVGYYWRDKNRDIYPLYDVPKMKERKTV